MILSQDRKPRKEFTVRGHRKKFFRVLKYSFELQKIFSMEIYIIFIVMFTK